MLARRENDRAKQSFCIGAVCDALWQTRREEVGRHPTQVFGLGERCALGATILGSQEEGERVYGSSTDGEGIERGAVRMNSQTSETERIFSVEVYQEKSGHCVARFKHESPNTQRILLKKTILILLKHRQKYMVSEDWTTIYTDNMEIQNLLSIVNEAVKEIVREEKGQQ
jgi:hypothetical protein